MISLKVVVLDIFRTERKNMFYSSDIFLISYVNLPYDMQIILKDCTFSVSQKNFFKVIIEKRNVLSQGMHFSLSNAM